MMGENKRYISTGLNMLDALKMSDGTVVPPHIGGIPMYGYCGMRLWTDSIEFVARVGEDFFDIFDPWFTDNGIDRRGLRVVSEKTPYNLMIYDDNQDFAGGGFFTGNWADADFWRPHYEDLEPLIDDNTRGFYITGDPAAPLWPDLLALKRKLPFKAMWEPNGSHTFPADREAAVALCRQIEMASFNLKEGCRIFGVDSEEALLDILKNLGPELVLLRCGARGLYTIHDKKAHFLPSAPLPAGVSVVDVTGCGNTSTAGACAAWCEGNDPVMTGIMANISASYNLRQMGPYPLFDRPTVDEARRLAEKLYAEGRYIAV